MMATDAGKTDLSALGDEELAGKVIQGDRTAFGLLYDRYVSSVYSYAHFIIGAELAEDAVQEVFMTFWRNARLFKPKRGSFRNWFLTLAHNKMNDVLRSSRRNGQEASFGKNTEKLGLVTADQGTDVADIVNDNQERAEIRSALKQIPAMQRQVISLAFFDGRSHTEIAAQLELPLGTVKKRIRLGMRKLRDLLIEIQSGNEEGRK